MWRRRLSDADLERPQGLQGRQEGLLQLQQTRPRSIERRVDIDLDQLPTSLKKSPAMSPTRAPSRHPRRTARIQKILTAKGCEAFGVSPELAVLCYGKVREPVLAVRKTATASGAVCGGRGE